MRFEKGNTYGKGGAKPGAGRPLSKEKVIKNFIKEYPNAYAELMQTLYIQGMLGEITAAQYVCDRLKGKPGVKIDLDVGVKPYDTLIKEIALAAPLLLKEGDDIIEGKEVEDATNTTTRSEDVKAQAGGADEENS